MNYFVGAAFAAALAVSSASGAETARYDLWRSVEDGRKVIAVSGQGADAPFAVAAGEKDLAVLAGDEAVAALDDLRARSSAHEKRTDIDAAVAKDGERQVEIVRIREKAEGGDKEKAGETKRIVIVTKDDEDEVDVRIEDEVAKDSEIVIKEKRIGSGEWRTRDGDAVTIELDDDDGAHSKFIRISGADAEAAADFIDETEGLDGAEKSAVKAALGLQ